MDGFRKLLINDSRFIDTDGGSSRGYTKKALVDGLWYKLTAGAFNAQAEVVASRLAKYTNIGDCVQYEMCTVNGEYATESKDFLSGTASETVKSLHAKVTGSPIEPMLEYLKGDQLFTYVSDIVNRGINLDLTAPDNFEKLSLLLQFDALVLNEDRHFNNIKFLCDKDGIWRFAPAFDFDCALFSCVEDLENLQNYDKPSLPFYPTHTKQLDWLYSKSNVRLTLRPFNVDDITRGVWDEQHQIGKREVEEYLKTLQETTL